MTPAAMAQAGACEDDTTKCYGLGAYAIDDLKDASFEVLSTPSPLGVPRLEQQTPSSHICDIYITSCHIVIFLLSFVQGCSLDASWIEIVRDAETGRYATGGLGKRMVLDEYEVWLCDRHDPCVRGWDGCMRALGSDAEAAVAQCASEFGPQLDEIGAYLDSGALYAKDALERMCDLMGQYFRCFPAACCDYQVEALFNSTDNPFAYSGYPCEVQCANDWMCYTYNENYKQFEPLSLNSRLQLVKDISNASNVSVSNNHPVESWSNFDGSTRRSKNPGGVGKVTSDASLPRLSSVVRDLASTLRASVADMATSHEALRAERAVKSRAPDVRETRGGSAGPTHGLKTIFDAGKNSAAFWSPWQRFDLDAIKGAVKSVSSSSFSPRSFSRRSLDTSPLARHGEQVSVKVENRRILKLRMLHEQGLITKDEMTRGIEVVISSIAAADINDAE